MQVRMGCLSGTKQSWLQVRVYWHRPDSKGSGLWDDDEPQSGSIAEALVGGLQDVDRVPGA